MRLLFLLGFLLQALGVMGYPKSVDQLEGRDLTGFESNRPNKLSKRTLSTTKNSVFCPAAGPDGTRFDLKDYNKCMTALISRHVPCAYFKDIVMFVETESGENAVFEDASPSVVRHIMDVRLNDECLVDNPVKPRSNLPDPPSADLGKSIQVLFYDNDTPSKQVITCTVGKPEYVFRPALQNQISPFGSMSGHSI
ncbi:uncharacterized protein MELLADRAFT_124032 [Melampsora larici-populina 98AG31]|uniref:Secreted protein n=1 Tax=Melampsora larici-populina (strain 98AG31 / pathotype 3-4-7) TaxID=747676 RepID=F4S5E2_MELLP|nr:uncharacterized protein MELLADRAFT_124032 [Melampsora larici-populina 98AG31]EGG00152.1 secreted protein [Melampsora larici-populina 98AG31]